MLHYILQTIVFQLLFLMVYDVFLKKETFFNWNRFYLLASAVLSIVLPFVKVDSFKTVIPKEYIYSLPEIIIGKANTTLNSSIEGLSAESASSFVFSWYYLIYLGCAISLVLFIFKFYKLIAMAYKNPKIKFETAFLVELANSKHAFSFFNYIFLGKDINPEDRQTILTHELQHIKEKHSVDLLFFEVLKILFWFNPLIYMYQKRIANLHEFIADFKAVKSSSKVHYYQNLLSQVFDTEKVSFINPFFKQSLIKKRIIMLSKSKSKQIHLVKYLLVFPMVIGMLFYTSCSSDEKIDKAIAIELDAELEQAVEEFRNQLNTQNSNFSKEERLELAEFIIDELKANLEDNETSSGTLTTQTANQVIEIEENISFAIIGQVPVFPGCDTSASNDDQRKCFSDKINKIVANNFNLDLGKSLGLKGKQRIYARFTIDKEGNVVDVKTRAPHPELEKEARRVVKLIPQVQPGKHDGKLANITFDLPIMFNVKE
ncbi:M56 family metallopeptidase [Lacinutrix sp. Bg11-31]|uniref:M56 family metallopeptidase n=1 Tax=Lacinutrix sp. Bg11-31 TaxID=2057808 RepID=UPI000C2FF740|nr:M56 family metallopeptidase [Lacinutrix sp. Bg11-31]AUC82580.1 blaR1 peptidase M56 family protein [Lacinutrix sp. Bg11-31]